MRIVRPVSLPRFNREIWLLGLAGALLGSGHQGIVPLLKVLYVLRLGRGPEFVGALAAIGSLSFMLASLPGAALGRRFGIRRTLLTGCIINVVGIAMVPFTEVLPGPWQSPWVLATEAIASVGWSIAMVNMVTALVAVTTVENRKNAYALREAMSGVCWFLGALVGGMLPGAFAGLLHTTTTDPEPYRYGIWVAVALALSSLVPLLFVPRLRDAPPAQAGRGRLGSLLPLAPLFACGFLFFGGVASCKAFIYAYMDREFLLPPSVVGVISSVGMILGIVGALSSSRLARKQGSGFSMLIASSSLAVGLALMGLIRHWAIAGVGTIAMFILSSLFAPAYQALQMESAESEWRWLVAGIGNMSTSLGYGTMSLTGGYVVAAMGYQQVFFLGALFAISGAGIMWNILHQKRAIRACEQIVRKSV